MTSLWPREICLYRLVLPSKQGYIETTPWIRFGTEGIAPAGDIVQIWCKKGLRTTYQFLHHQIYKGPSSPSTDQFANHHRPNVHILVVDSASMPHLRRALPNTMEYLSKEMGAEFFLFHNKKAAGTVAQSHVLLMGKLVERYMNRPKAKPFPWFWTSEVEACSANSTFVLKHFKEKGYKVLLSEDWTCNLFSSCRNNETLPVDHYMSLYWVKLKHLFPETDALSNFGPAGRMYYHSNLWPRYCIQRHEEMFKYLEDFMEKYKNEPQFTVTWLGYLQHDWRGDLYQHDQSFLNFFKRIKNQTADSHFFFLGDHGNRLYADKTIFWDRAEDMNPALIYIPPRDLKNNRQVMRRIRQNSQQLVSTMDIYATLVDIVKQTDNYTSPETQPHLADLQKLKGSSLLRELIQPRNCDTLDLSYEHCLCQDLAPKTRTHPLTEVLTKAAIDYFNSVIQESADKDICAELKLAQDYEPYVEEYQNNVPAYPEAKVYVVTLKTHPGNALFNPYVMMHNNGTTEVVSFVTRKNAWGHQARCVHERHNTITFSENFCFCKNLLNNTSEVNKVNNK
ncbi:unnamed protein product [Bursaphelenchus xylophilus]|uniref:(pine wood nematode) hypothetical protein n=1 Tax=Bursaphelenchus xylophilus TaxID=6326 RepID=A0A811LZY1_BURXY|nr:unnamed protein product [Bursaphelenchus xylophilus]CAG9125197.1 unnamed protein product [Bursaphelenchus xylophilus]